MVLTIFSLSLYKNKKEMELKLKILKGSTQKIWITSDTHHSHKNICRGVTEWRTKDKQIPVAQTRPFNTLEEMNEKIINNINKVVGQDDILIHDGDFSFGGIENIWRFRSRIICKNIYHIIGNHDHHIENDRILPNCHFDDNDNIVDGPVPIRYGDSRDQLFAVTARQLFIQVFEKMYLIVSDENKFIKHTLIIQHFPEMSWNGLNNGYIHLHGHMHLPNDKKLTGGRRMDIGIDGHPEFRPYDLIEECIKPLRKLEIKSSFDRLDHHMEEFEHVLNKN